MMKYRGSLTHKRWMLLLLVLSMALAALPAMARGQNEAIVCHPDGGAYVNAREWNSFDAPILFQVQTGTKVEIVRQDGTWFCIIANEQAGYIHGSFLTKAPHQNKDGKQATITAGPLNLREAPSTRARVITQLYSGETVTVLRFGDTWSQVQVGDMCGYVSSTYLAFASIPAPAPAPNPAPNPAPQPPKPIVTKDANATIKTQNGGNLNLREWASSDAKVLGSYANGTRVRVLTHGAAWSRVQVGDAYGYMVTKYLKYDGMPSGPDTLKTNAVVASSGLLNLRAEPSADSRVLGQFKNGTAIQVVGVGTQWHRVSVGGKVGYMMAKYVKLTDKTLTPHKTVENKNSFVNLRTAAGYEYPVLKQVPHGAAVTIVAPGSAWSRVIVKDGAGYLAGFMLNSFIK